MKLTIQNLSYYDVQGSRVFESVITTRPEDAYKNLKKYVFFKTSSFEFESIYQWVFYTTKSVGHNRYRQVDVDSVMFFDTKKQAMSYAKKMFAADLQHFPNESCEYKVYELTEFISRESDSDYDD